MEQKFEKLCRNIVNSSSMIKISFHTYSRSMVKTQFLRKLSPDNQNASSKVNAANLETTPFTDVPLVQHNGTRLQLYQLEQKSSLANEVTSSKKSFFLRMR